MTKEKTLKDFGVLVDAVEVIGLTEFDLKRLRDGECLLHSIDNNLNVRLIPIIRR